MFIRDAKLNFIDIFAGAGGLSEGFLQEGFNPIAHVEMNSEACKTLETRSAYDGCKYFVWLKNNAEFWRRKISANSIRDQENYKKLQDSGWRVLIIWECEIKGNRRTDRLESVCKIIRDI